MSLLNMNLRKMVGINQGRERLDVLLTIMLPLVLMFVSAYTNAWAFAGGDLSFDPTRLVNTIDAWVRGLFVEALVFSCFLLVRVLVFRGWLAALSALVPAFLGLIGMTVSAGCGLAWVAKSGQMDWMIHIVSTYLPSWMASLFQLGLGLLFPVALAVYALYDVRHIIHEHVERDAQLGTLTVQVESAEHHQDMLRKVQHEEDSKVENYYRQIAQANAQRAVESAKSGDLSFGLRDVMKTQQLQQQAEPTITRVLSSAPTVQLPPMQNGGYPPPPPPNGMYPFQRPYQQPYPPQQNISIP